MSNTSSGSGSFESLPSRCGHHCVLRLVPKHNRQLVHCRLPQFLQCAPALPCREECNLRPHRRCSIYSLKSVLVDTTTGKNKGMEESTIVPGMFWPAVRPSKMSALVHLVPCVP